MANDLSYGGGGGGGGGGSNVMLRRTESSTDTLVAMLASCSPVGLQVQRSVGGGLEDAVVGCGQKRSFYPTFEMSAEDVGDDDGGDDCNHNVEKKRRLTFDQVRSLERNFELENKLEPERKMQLAKELGLQPRQVAVWFQNRRARWKTKQLERDYEVLTVDYNRLKTEFDAVLQEKQELQAEIDGLAEKKTSIVPPEAESKPLENSKSSDVSPSQMNSCHKASEVGNSAVKTEITRAPELMMSISSRLDAEALIMSPRGSTRSSKDPPPHHKLGPRGAVTSSESTSSEILDADSPRTIDSSSHHVPPLVLPLPTVLQPDDKLTVATITSPTPYPPPISATDLIPHHHDNNNNNLMQCGMGDPLSDSPPELLPAACHRVINAVKLEAEGSSFPDDPCNYLFPPQLDEPRALVPWWDWA